MRKKRKIEQTPKNIQKKRDKKSSEWTKNQEFDDETIPLVVHAGASQGRGYDADFVSDSTRRSTPRTSSCNCRTC